MKLLNCLLLSVLSCIYFSAYNKKQSLKEKIPALKQEWGLAFPVPSQNDSIKLLYIQLEKSYFTFEREKTDSLARRILNIESTLKEL